MQVRLLLILLSFNSNIKDSFMGLETLLLIMIKVYDKYNYFMIDIMFVLDSDMNVLTRVDAYLSNMKMPW